MLVVAATPRVIKSLAIVVDHLDLYADSGFLSYLAEVVMPVIATMMTSLTRLPVLS